jgi:hypothetical protein
MIENDHATITHAADQHQPTLGGDSDATDLEIGEQAYLDLKNPTFNEWLSTEWPNNKIESFDDWLVEAWRKPEEESNRVLSKGVMAVMFKALTDPDVQARSDGDNHIVLSDGHTHDGTKLDLSPFISFVNGGLIREDRIYDAFPYREEDVREVLNCLGSELIVRGAFKPSDGLQAAFLHAYTIAEKPEKPTKGKKKNAREGMPFAPHAACLAAAEGDLRAAALLHQIRYWFHKAKATFDGKRFIAKTAKEWSAETGLSLSQYHRAVRKLKDLGIVETEQHLFAGRAQTFLRPITYLGLPAVGVTPPPEQ